MVNYFFVVFGGCRMTREVCCLHPGRCRFETLKQPLHVYGGKVGYILILPGPYLSGNLLALGRPLLFCCIWLKLGKANFQILV